MKPHEPVARKGEIVHCRSCGRPLYRLTRDCVLGQTVASASLFTPIGTSAPLEDGFAADPCVCGQGWFPEWIRRPWATRVDNVA
jgi:hypothetical protein